MSLTNYIGCSFPFFIYICFLHDVDKNISVRDAVWQQIPKIQNSPRCKWDQGIFSPALGCWWLDYFLRPLKIIRLLQPVKVISPCMNLLPRKRYPFVTLKTLLHRGWKLWGFDHYFYWNGHFSSFRKLKNLNSVRNRMMNLKYQWERSFIPFSNHALFISQASSRIKESVCRTYFFKPN